MALRGDRSWPPGASPKYLQRQMGHSSIRVPLNLYGQLIPEIERGAFQAPKTKAGWRVVEVQAALVPILLAYRAAQEGLPNVYNLVFPNEHGCPLEGRTVRRRHCKAAL